MLLNKLYIINALKSSEKDTVIADLTINDQDEIFNGHFPGRPVMPGVCLINMLTDVVSLSENKKYMLKSADYVKFIAVLQPAVNAKVNVRIRKTLEAEDILKAEASVFFENTVFLKFKGCFEVLKR